MAAGYAQTASFSVNIHLDREEYNLAGAEAFSASYQLTEDYRIARRDLSTNNHSDYAGQEHPAKGQRL